ncbi:UNVERIFIED_CONTAM: hypothetical protein NY603_35745, partial [Bacteroidetes bacterium 56_B9]
ARYGHLSAPSIQLPCSRIIVPGLPSLSLCSFFSLVQILFFRLATKQPAEPQAKDRTEPRAPLALFSPQDQALRPFERCQPLV